MVLAIVIGFIVPAVLFVFGIVNVLRRSYSGSRVQFGLRELLAIPVALIPILVTQPVGENRTMLLVIIGSFLIYQFAGILWGWLLATANPDSRLGWKPALGIVIGGWLAVVLELVLATTLNGRQM